MTDLVLTLFMVLFLAMGLRRPFVWTLAYLYVDIVQPQNITYHLLAQVPLSLIVFVLAVGGWMISDRRQAHGFSFRQFLILLLLVYCGLSTQSADFAKEAADKWDWVWKALVFALFLPFALGTRLRIEAAALVMSLAVGSIMISGALKTLIGGGGYGSLRLFIDNNTGIYEGSTISTCAIALIPLILWLGKHGTIFPADRRTRLFSYALVFAALLIPVGTVARTGIICMLALGTMMLRSVKNKGLYIALVVVGVAIALPLLPTAFNARVSTIQNNQSDESAQTRVAVWKWTLGYVADHPFGGGFEAYRGDKIKVVTTDTNASGNVIVKQQGEVYDQARAFHSAYFEMLGEQGWPGLILWLVLQFSGLVQLQHVRMKLRRSDDPLDKRDAALAIALQEGHIVYLVGALFVGIAFQPFVYMLLGLQIALAQQVGKRVAARSDRANSGLVVPRAPMQPLGA